MSFCFVCQEGEKGRTGRRGRGRDQTGLRGSQDRTGRIHSLTEDIRKYLYLYILLLQLTGITRSCCY
jgi:hypothetical protein